MMSINERDRPTTKEILEEPFFKDYESIIQNCKKSEEPDLIAANKFKYVRKVELIQFVDSLLLASMLEILNFF